MSFDNASPLRAEKVQFVIVVPGAEPKNVSYTQSTLPSSVKNTAVKKVESINGNTNLTLEYQFDKVGTITLPQIRLRVKTRSYTLSFPQINVRENPSRMSASIFWQVLNDTNPLQLELRAQYITNLHKISSPLVEWGIMTEKMRAPLGKDLTDDSCKPDGVLLQRYNLDFFLVDNLASQTFTLPQVSATVDGTNGEVQQIVTPKITVQLKMPTNSTQTKALASPLPQSESAVQSTKPQVDGMAQTNTPQNNTAQISTTQNVQSATITEADAHKIAKNIAQLRAKERKTFFNAQIIQERLNAEKASGAVSDVLKSRMELPLAFLFGAFAFALVLFLLALVCNFLHKRKSALAMFVVASVFVIAGLGFVLYGAQDRGVFCGGKIYTVPDLNSSFCGSIPCGSTVIVQKASGAWCLVSFGTVSGWIDRSLVYKISTSGETW